MTNPGVAGALIVLSVLAASCGLIPRGDWPGPVPIDPANWEIEIDVCGPIEDVPLEWIEGRVINTTEERSPFYDIYYTLTYEDGSVIEDLANEIVAPTGAGGSSEFSFSISVNEGKTITSCDLIVVDAVENYS